MKQILQSLKNGDTILEEVPLPQIKPGHVLIKSVCSLISIGTEKMLVEFGKSSIYEKAKQQPERVKQILNKIRTDGLISTLNAVYSKLEEPLPLGYCNAGVVMGVGDGITDIQVGDRVASNGPHAEIVLVPRNLIAKIPEKVSFEESAFTVIGSIALQGIRLSKPEIGETFVVLGLGLVGQLTCQLLIANGCKVIGFDYDAKKIELAKTKGVIAVVLKEDVDPVPVVYNLSNGVGADGVLITATTQSSDIVSQAARMSRKRGKIILVGVVGLELNRSDFYEKELLFQISCSYGPGRYDPEYELKGNDYPLPFIRWTENRNFSTILECIARGVLDVKPLITHSVEIENAVELYNHLSNSNHIGVIIKYKEKAEDIQKLKVIRNPIVFQEKLPVFALIGAGNYTRLTLLPVLSKMRLPIKYICSEKGTSSTQLAKKYGIEYSTTSYEEVLKDPAVSTVIITTRHNLHASMCVQALQAGKHVFVEKPLAINREELEKIIEVSKNSKGLLFVGFNRRFSLFSQKVFKLLPDPNISMNIVITVNAGFIPKNHWTQDPAISGGRIIGEGCHFIDLVAYLAQSPIQKVFAASMGNQTDSLSDNVSILLKCRNGSQGIVNYFANGNKAYTKERVEIYSQGKIIVIDDFHSMIGYGFKGFHHLKTFRQNKGHRAEMEVFIEYLKNQTNAPMTFESIVNSTEASFAALESLQTSAWVSLKYA